MRSLLLLSILNLISIISGSNEPLMDILKNYDKVTKVTNLCSQHLTILRDEIKSEENWALKVRDVSGKKSFGFITGNNFWIGSEKSCESLNYPSRIFLRHSDRRKMWDNATDIRAIISMQYRMFYIAHASRLQFDIDLFNQSVIHIGLCLPMGCIEKDAIEFGEKILVPITCKGSAVIGKQLSFEGTKLLQLRENFINDIFVKFLIYIIFFFGSMVAIGTFYIGIKRNHSKTSAEKSSFCNLHLKKRKTVIDKFLSCFALQKNLNFIMSSNLGTESLETIHGIRTIGIFYIIIGHVYYYALPSIDNLQKAFSDAEKFILQPFFAAAISVDSFYTISGILLAYGFYEKQRRRPSKNLMMDVLRGAVYRYIRIVPCFMIVMLFAVSMSIFLNDTSQYRVVENLELNCKHYWWRNLLFIQNFYPLSEMCMSWSWYVSTDFQLFIVCSIILAISAKNMKLAVFLSILIASICSLYAGYVGINESFGFSLDNQYRSIDKLYTKPYTRAAQYITGLWTGYYLSKTNKHFGLGKRYVNLGWILSIATVLSLIFVQIYKKINVWVSFMFPAIGRILWALPICFFVIAGTSQYKDGFFAKILNSKPLLPFSRMSFSAYLFNPLVVMFLTLGSESPYHLDYYMMVIVIFGFYVVTYLAALIFMLFFENPIIMFTRKFISS